MKNLIAIQFVCANIQKTPTKAFNVCLYILLHNNVLSLHVDMLA